MGAGHAHALYVHEHSRIHHMGPEAKVLATFLVIISVAITPRQAIWAFAVYALILFALIVISRVPVRFVVTRLASVIPFVLFALFLPFIGTGETASILGLTVSVEGTWAMWNILVKATLGASFSILLAATTETAQVLRGMRRLRVPAILTAIASFMIRYLEVIAGEMGRMRTAMAARGYQPTWIGQARPIAAASGALFTRSYERGERVYQAMLSRGFSGTMPNLGTAPATKADWALALVVAGVALITAVTALVNG
jgi:cobalt/nickel transport system permease protein